MKPLIGITTGEIHNLAEPWSPVTYGQSHTYSDSIIAAGGLPVLIPITSDTSVLEQIFSTLDGILFAGGNDINPAVYGKQPYPETHDYSDPRDDTEICLMQAALAQSKPILAICRGMQLLNVVSGGTLHQHIATDIPGSSDHQISTRKQTRSYIAHQLTIHPGTKLSKIMRSPSVAANSHHHQAVDALGQSLRVAAVAEDGVIEAIESTDADFVVGVQCHPEALHSVEPQWNQVFQSFVATADVTRS